MRPIPILFLLLSIHAHLHAQSSISDSDKYAYGANTGWINLKHDQPSAPTGVILGECFASGYGYSGNIGWIHFGDGSPDNGHTYSNSSATDYGVNHDNLGNLTGYAYSANTGWINFGWASSDDANRPRIDLFTGDAAGYAYSANLGWINLGSGQLTVTTIIRTDTDNDGIDDTWEMKTFGNLTTVDGTSDHDGDTISDYAEYKTGSDPTAANAPLQITHHDYNEDYDYAQITFDATVGRNYRIEYSSDLNVWTDSSLGTFAVESTGPTTEAFSYPTNGESKFFFRVVVDTPLN